VTNDGVVAFDTSVLVDSAEKLVAVTSDGKAYPLTLVVRDPLSSLGLGRIDGKQFSIAAFGVDADLSVGQTLFEVEVDALRGQPLFFERTLAAKSTRPDDQRGLAESTEAITRFLRIETPSDSGSGGSVIIDQRGSVIGMRLKSPQAQLVLSVAYIRSALKSFTVHQEIERVKFGALVYDILTVPGLSEEATDGRKAGALISNGQAGEPAVASDGPADKAGLAAGDLILSVEDNLIDATHSLTDVVQTFDVGQTVSVRYVRDGSEQTASLTLGKFQ
jgi:putative serine protease PepD